MKILVLLISLWLGLQAGTQPYEQEGQKPAAVSLDTLPQTKSENTQVDALQKKSGAWQYNDHLRH
jgi:hypothetical protein